MIKTRRSKKTKHTVWEIDTTKLLGTYYVLKTSSFYKLSKSITLIGFKGTPTGLSGDGYGFSSPAGSFLASALSSVLGENIYITLSKEHRTEISKYQKKWRLTFKHSDYLEILNALRAFRKEKNDKSNEYVSYKLYKLFPTQFPQVKPIESAYVYEDDKISKIFGNLESYDELSKKDIDIITDVGLKFQNQNKPSFRTISVQNKSKLSREKIYLETVLQEFELRLPNSKLSESDWQKFLHLYILLFNTNYIRSLEKINVDLRLKFPDFMLIDAYGYLDVFEIKKPSTGLLKYDSGRDNYFWDTEVNKAIIQTEKYLAAISSKPLEIQALIKDKHSIDVRAVRPRGFIIVGTGEQLTDQKMKDDFRILASSLRNISVLLYDDLLNNLRNLIKRLE